MTRKQTPRSDGSSERKTRVKTRKTDTQKSMQIMISSLSQKYMKTEAKLEEKGSKKHAKGRQASMKNSKTSKITPVSSPEVFNFDESDEENISLKIKEKSVSKLKRKIYQIKRKNKTKNLAKTSLSKTSQKTSDSKKPQGKSVKSTNKCSVQTMRNKCVRTIQKSSGMLMDDSGVFMTPDSVESSLDTNTATSTPHLPNNRRGTKTKISPNESDFSFRQTLPSPPLLSPVEMVTPIAKAQILSNASSDYSQFSPVVHGSPEPKQSLLQIPPLTYSRGDTPIAGKLTSRSAFLYKPKKKKVPTATLR